MGFERDGLMERLAFRIASQPRAILNQGKNPQLAACWEGLRPGVLSPPFGQQLSTSAISKPLPNVYTHQSTGLRMRAQFMAAVVLGLTLGTSLRLVFGANCELTA